ncbi:MAG: cysteine desulfurase [Candidatus Magasanikbacteria bacterium CG_4_9_14_3_um_filter_32_9]|uniref:Cysteine desulfurase n=1 Tax=Candidatus Magasanikbacteria bacterium CG_4_9_14_3_um_filter_32_9 TaxID=1974644 RepID=A0A2M7Z764_9BACT|nr:MAG: cysteine desulfurase [Candidatus Magasanikbacteria bacterium CG_4_9_14_3_um_filter_32_9]
MKLGKDIKKDFKIFDSNNLVYLDNGATAQIPNIVVEEMNNYYSVKSNIHRGAYKLSGNASKKYEDARKVIADFLSAESQEIVLTGGTTSGINMLSQMLCKDLKAGDNIVLTRLEHHANLIPWQQKSKEKGFEIRFIELNKNLELDLESAKKLIDEKTKIVSFVHVSNALGVISPAKKLIKIAKKVGAITILDGAQSIVSIEVNVKDLDCDFFIFSGHKLYGPTGVGVIFGKIKLLEKLEPVNFGGDMISKVSYIDAIWNEVPFKFEAGTPPIAQVVGLAKSIKYMQDIGMKAVFEHEQNLCSYTIKSLKEIEGLSIIAEEAKRVSIISFVIEGVHPHDIASILDSQNIAVRAGHHCTMPLMKHLGINGTTRISFGIYNDVEDVDRLVEGLKKVKELF